MPRQGPGVRPGSRLFSAGRTHLAAWARAAIRGRRAGPGVVGGGPAARMNSVGAGPTRPFGWGSAGPIGSAGPAPDSARWSGGGVAVVVPSGWQVSSHPCGSSRGAGGTAAPGWTARSGRRRPNAAGDGRHTRRPAGHRTGTGSRGPGRPARAAAGPGTVRVRRPTSSGWLAPAVMIRLTPASQASRRARAAGIGPVKSSSAAPLPVCNAVQVDGDVDVRPLAGGVGQLGVIEAVAGQLDERVGAPLRAGARVGPAAGAGQRADRGQHGVTALGVEHPVEDDQPVNRGGNV